MSLSLYQKNNFVHYNEDANEKQAFPSTYLLFDDVITKEPNILVKNIKLSFGENVILIKDDMFIRPGSLAEIREDLSKITNQGISSELSYIEIYEILNKHIMSLIDNSLQSASVDSEFTTKCIGRDSSFAMI